MYQQGLRVTGLGGKGYRVESSKSHDKDDGDDLVTVTDTHLSGTKLVTSLQWTTA